MNSGRRQRYTGRMGAMQSVGFYLRRIGGFKKEPTHFNGAILRDRAIGLVIYINRYLCLKFFICKDDGIRGTKFPLASFALASGRRRWERRLQRMASGCVHSRVTNGNVKEIHV